MQSAEEDRRHSSRPSTAIWRTYTRPGRDDFEAAAESLKTYVLGHIRKHGSYPEDLEIAYDHLALFGESRMDRLGSGLRGNGSAGPEASLCRPGVAYPRRPDCRGCVLAGRRGR